MKKTSKCDRGMAGTIMAMLIFGLLMTISTAYMTMVQTEAEVQGMIDYTDRAVDAAFSGINYGIAIAQANRAMCEKSVAACASRTYIIATTTSLSNWTGINAAWTTTKVNQVASVPSDWLFLNEKLDNYLINNVTASPPYQFRVTSYPAATNTYDLVSNASPSLYLIKAQGRYLTYSDDQSSVVATFTAQLIAECKIDFSRKVVQLARYRFMPYDGTEARFFKAVPY
jgi:hypothetical protein